jgi:hypothetical protein
MNTRLALALLALGPTPLERSPAPERVAKARPAGEHAATEAQDSPNPIAALMQEWLAGR